jgi:hypothetical protein
MRRVHFGPRHSPFSPRPWRNAATKSADVPGDIPLRNPITGIAGCSARAARASAAPVGLLHELVPAARRIGARRRRGSSAL